MAGGVAAAVPAALFAALCGTALHRQEWMLSGAVLPWGAAAALVLLGSVQLLLGAAFRSPLPTAVCGVVCYVLAGWWSAMAPGKRLIAGDLPGNVWVYGIAGVTVLMLVWARRYRRRDREDAATAGSVATPAGGPS